MKNLDIKNPLFLRDFSGETSEEVRTSLASEFEVSRDEVDKFQLLICWLEEGGYESSIWLLLRCRESGNLFEIHASHCSCYGYEGEFKPEPTTLEYLLSDKFSFFGLEANKSAITEFFKTL